MTATPTLPPAMPDGGSARCDFPGGDAAELYRTVQRLYALPAETRLFVCHDYSPGGREPRCETTVAAQREGNIHVRDGVSEASFVEMRRTRDATLDVHGEGERGRAGEAGDGVDRGGLGGLRGFGAANRGAGDVEGAPG